MLAYNQIKKEFQNQRSYTIKERIQESINEPIGGIKSFQSQFDAKQCADVPEMLKFVKSVKKANMRKDQKRFGIIPDDSDSLMIKKANLQK